MTFLENAKNAAAAAAVKDCVTKNVRIIGIGSGSTVVYVVKNLAIKVKEENLDLVFIPSSFQSQQVLLESGLKLSTLTETPILDIVFDGADEIDCHLDCIKGGGGCLTLEKINASCSKKLVIIADHSKLSSVLGEKWKKGIPLEIIPVAYIPILAKLKELGGKPELRMAVAKAGPVVTDNGNFIVDVDFGLIHNPQALNQKLINIPGVVETGLFLGMAKKAYIGLIDGTVEIIKCNS